MASILDWNLASHHAQLAWAKCQALLWPQMAAPILASLGTQLTLSKCQVYCSQDVLGSKTYCKLWGADRQSIQCRWAWQMCHHANCLAAKTFTQSWILIYVLASLTKNWNRAATKWWEWTVEVNGEHSKGKNDSNFTLPTTSSHSLVKLCLVISCWVLSYSCHNVDSAGAVGAWIILLSMTCRFL